MFISITLKTQQSQQQANCPPGSDSRQPLALRERGLLGYVQTAGKCDPNPIFLPICDPYPIFSKQSERRRSDFFKSDPGHFRMWSWIGYVSDLLQCDFSLNGQVAFHPTFTSFQLRFPENIDDDPRVMSLRWAWIYSASAITNHITNLQPLELQQTRLCFTLPRSSKRSSPGTSSPHSPGHAHSLPDERARRAGGTAGAPRGEAQSTHRSRWGTRGREALTWEQQGAAGLEQVKEETCCGCICTLFASCTAVQKASSAAKASALNNLVSFTSHERSRPIHLVNFSIFDWREGVIFT